MKLKSVMFLASVASPATRDESMIYPPPVTGGCPYLLTTDGTYVRIDALDRKTGKPTGTRLVPLSNVRWMEPDEDAPKK